MNNLMSAPLSEPRIFHTPGSLSTWFRGWFRPPAPVPPPATTVPERQALLAEITRERARWDEERPGLERRTASARDRLTEARTLLRDAEQCAAECEAEGLSASMASDHRVRQLEARLRDGASEHIKTFLLDVRNESDVLRGRDVVGVAERWGRRDPLTGERAHTFVSNAASVERRAAALTAARHAAEALRLEPIDDEAVLVRLTALRDGIPEAEPFSVEFEDPLTPGERRALEWRLADQEAAR